MVDSIMVSMDADSDSDDQFDTDEEELCEKVMLRIAAAAANCVFFAAVCGSQVCSRFHNIKFPWHTITWPVITTNSRSRPPASDADVHTRRKTHWTIFEEAVLIQFLFERKDRMTWRAMFNYIVFNEAAKALNRFHEKGARKTSISCRSKWTRVRCSISCCARFKPVILALH